MEKELKISICGDLCSECPRYKATIKNDVSELEKISELWFRLGFRDKKLPYEDLKCFGCSKEKSCSYDLNICKFIKDKDNCGECDFFPCSKIEEVFEKTEEIKSLCKKKCSEIEFNEMNEAFFRKKEILTKINCQKSLCTRF
ncbi:MAG TPA: DUF3795 domain-containing protein [Spirochaetota bacterium]|nr:DUF3795 domain-containing protein [Spirochaetota bacterium]